MKLAEDASARLDAAQTSGHYESLAPIHIAGQVWGNIRLGYRVASIEAQRTH